MVSFDSKDELKDWLNKQDIDTTSWGTGQSKTLLNLWDEYVTGEIAIQGNPPLRRIRVVQIMLRRNNQVLLEIEQEMVDLRRRSRNVPPSEKMKPAESIRAVVTRCLYEELGVVLDQIVFIANEHEKSERTKESPSYPGLPTHYTFYKVEAAVQGLPDQDFWRDNAASKSYDPVKRHRWGWRAD